MQTTIRSAFSIVLLFFAASPVGLAAPISSPPTNLNATHFLSPIFENLDENALLSAYSRLGDSKNDNTQRVWLELFLAERFELSHHIHKSRDWLNKALDSCTRFEKEDFASVPTTLSGSTKYLCALVLVEQMKYAFILSRMRLHTRVVTLLQSALKSSAPKSDRWYAEGRIYSQLPRGFGQNFKKALIPLQFLKRLHPSSTSIDYWLARTVRRQGRFDLEEKYFKSALKHRDARSLLLFPNGKYNRLARIEDGLQSYMRLRPGYEPSKGLGAQLIYRNDQLADTNRALIVKAGLYSNPHWFASVNYADSTWIPHTRIEATARYLYSKDAFYGLGIDSPDANPGSYTYQQYYWRLGVRRNFLDHFNFYLGWQYTNHHAFRFTGTEYSTLLVTDRDNSIHTGPTAMLGFDNTNSHIDPWIGSSVELKGYFPSDFLGSQKSFEKLELHLRHYLPVGTFGRFAFGASTVSTSSTAPFPAFPKLSGPYPAIRINRFIERNYALFLTEFKFHLSGPFDAFVFGTAGTMNAQWSNIFSNSSWKAGTGGGIEIATSPFPNHKARLEAGLFAGQFIFRGGVVHKW